MTGATKDSSELINNQCKHEMRLKIEPSTIYFCLKRKGHKGEHEYETTF